MRRQLLVNGMLLALALGTLGVLWVTRELPSTSDLTARRDKLLPTFNKDAIERIRITQAGRDLELARDPQDPGRAQFRIERPWSERADIATVNQLLGALDLASALRPADGVTVEQAGLDKQALRIVLQTAQSTEQLTLGGPAPTPAGARYLEVTRAGSARRYLVSPSVAEELSPAFDKFREPRLLEFGRSELARIQLVGPEGSVELEQRGHGSFFILSAGSAELARREVIERILTSLSRLSTERFIEPDQAQAAVSKAPLLVRIQLKDQAAAPIVLRFASTCPAAPTFGLVLTEQPGRAPRAGCIPSEVVAALRVTESELRLTGPFSARADEVEELSIARSGKRLDLARKDKSFVLRAPSQGEVPLDAGNQRLAAILGAQGERVEGSMAAALGLDPAAGEVVVQVAGGNEVAHRQERVLLGAPRSDGGVCLRRTLDGVTLCLTAESARAFEPDATLLRGLELVRFAPSDLVSFSIEADGSHQVVRRAQDGTYQLDEPPGYTHDGALVADAVQTLGTLRAARWVAASDEPAFGLARPRLRVRFTLAPSASVGRRELRVGAPTAGGFFAQLTPDPAVFVVPRSAYSDLSLPLIDRALCRFSKAELVRMDIRVGTRRLSITRQGETWSGASLSEERALQLIETLTALRAEFAVHFGKPKPEQGFAQPSVTISMVGAGGRDRLLLGARDTVADSTIVYARIDSVDATFALSQRSAQVLRDL